MSLCIYFLYDGIKLKKEVIVIDFVQALNFVLDREGGLNKTTEGFDAGGVTNQGISLRFLKEVPLERLKMFGIFSPIDETVIEDLSASQIHSIYFYEFWEQARFKEIEHQSLVNYIFDMAVSHGIAQAIKLVQEAICAATFKRDYLVQDGVMGPKTIAAINKYGNFLLPIIIAVRARFYHLIVEKRPKDKDNLNGWLNRCYKIERVTASQQNCAAS